jgi:hypothetical protein
MMGFASLYPSYETCLCLLQRLERIADIGVEPAAARIHVTECLLHRVQDHQRCAFELAVLGDDPGAACFIP